MDTTLARLKVGQLLDGRYRVDARIARGGMATVYLGTDTRLERTVALKIAHPELAHDADFVRRFIAEARSAARLSSPNVVAVYDQGAEGDILFLAMEYVPGRTLRELLTERGKLGPGEALDIIEGVLTGLAAAHAAGVVHRDVKPENVLITPGHAVKVADFGLARAAAAASHTKTGTIIGTAAYLAPEQVSRSTSDSRTDVYAAGVMLFELLTGSQPHTGETPLAVAYKHVNEVVPAPSGVTPGLPAALDALVALATSRNPDLRPADAGQFLQEITEVRRGLPVTRARAADLPAGAGPGGGFEPGFPPALPAAGLSAPGRSVPGLPAAGVTGPGWPAVSPAGPGRLAAGPHGAPAQDPAGDQAGQAAREQARPPRLPRRQAHRHGMIPDGLIPDGLIRPGRAHHGRIRHGRTSRQCPAGNRRPARWPGPRRHRATQASRCPARRPCLAPPQNPVASHSAARRPSPAGRLRRQLVAARGGDSGRPAPGAGRPAIRRAASQPGPGAASPGGQPPEGWPADPGAAAASMPGPGGESFPWPRSPGRHRPIRRSTRRLRCPPGQRPRRPPRPGAASAGMAGAAAQGRGHPARGDQRTAAPARGDQRQLADPDRSLNHTLIVADQGFVPGHDDQPLTGRVHGPAGYVRRREPGLQRWLFSRRLAYLALAAAVMLVLGLMTWWVTDGQFVTIPRVGTMTKATARTELRNLGFAVKTGHGVHRNGIPRGEVVRTVPAVGARAHRGSLVTLIPSLGPVLVRVPSVTGLKLADAAAALRRAGLTPGKVTSATSSTIPLGVVISTNPVAGLSWPQTKPVAIVQSSGLPLPNLVGQQESAAQGQAQQDGFQLNPQQDTNSDQPAGTITAQSPRPGTSITPGEVVTIKVSTGPQLVAIPNVDGQNERQATATLTAAGFGVNVDQVGPGHRVFNFSPTGQAPKGSTITIFVGFGGFGNLP